MSLRTLEGQRVLVTGASSGIGEATAKAFLLRGAEVVATGRREEPLLKLAVPERKARLTTIVGDLRNYKFTEELVQRAGSVDVLVNCAGVLKHAPFLELDPVDWLEAFEVNVTSLLHVTQLVARGMREQKHGHIINISSTRAEEVAPMTMVYSATKFAVRAISKGLRAELRSFGIRVTEIAPGFTDSSIRRDVKHPAAIATFVNPAFTPLTVEDVARAVIFAAEADANCSTDLIVLRPMKQE
jgi:NADP-dependent 3-hydroxy acid dehydrogenase YdfG